MKVSNRIAKVYGLCKIFFWKWIMAADRRNTDNRRDGDSRLDRRQKNDRRTGGRRDKDSVESKGAQAGSAPSRKGPAEKKVHAGFSKIFKKFAVLMILAAVIFTAGTILFFANLDYFMDKVGQRVLISVDRALLDPESLTGKTTRARLNFRVTNTLPLGVVFQKLHFNVNMSEYTIARGMQASPRITIEASRETIVPVACSVDSIVTRRALQKTIERNAGQLLKGLLSRAQGKAQTFGDDIKGLIKITGSAEFRLKAGGVEMPFTRKLNF